VNCKFLNFGVNIEKALKFHGLKMHFSKKKKKIQSTSESEFEIGAVASTQLPLAQASEELA
jgi:hypothetical protein